MKGAVDLKSHVSSRAGAHRTSAPVPRRALPPDPIPTVAPVAPPILPDEPTPAAGGPWRGLAVAARGLGLALVAGTLALVIHVARLGAVPTLWLAGGAAALLVPASLTAFGLWRTRAPDHPVRTGLLATWAGLCLAATLTAVTFSEAIRAFFYEDIQPPEQLTATYDVIALPDHADGLGALTDERVGYLTTDPQSEAAMVRLDEVVRVTYAEFADLGTLTEALIAGDIDAALLDRAYRSLYDNNRPGFMEGYRVLYTFTLTRPARAPAVAAVAPTAAAPAAAATDPFLVYLSGIDQYGPIDVRGRSDVNILAAVNPLTRQILLVSTPRDYYVQLHGTTGLRDKLTHAGVYGIDLSVATMEDLYGLDIDYYIRVNFDTVVNLVDLVGGVDVYCDEAFTTLHGGYAIAQGWNHLDGDQALGFGRERYAFSTGDRARGENQQRVIEAVIKKVLQPGQLAHFDELRQTIAAGLETSVPADRLMAIVNHQLSEGGAWTVERTSVDGFDATGPTYSYNADLYVMEPDPASLDAARARLAAVLGR
jgi:LCP family protein required for cell wall assembly